MSDVLTALSLLFLYMANLLQTIRLVLVAAASLFAVAAVIEGGIVSSLFVYVGSSGISALLLPDKTAVLIYVLFFGYYPVIKSVAERVRAGILQWAVKIAVFEIAFSLIWFLFRSLVFNANVISTSVILVYITGTLAFIVFDIGLSRLIGFYICRISKNIKNNKQ